MVEQIGEPLQRLRLFGVVFVPVIDLRHDRADDARQRAGERVCSLVHCSTCPRIVVFNVDAYAEAVPVPAEVTAAAIMEGTPPPGKQSGGVPK